MVVDCRFGLKNSIETNGGADTASRWDYQYYFNHSQLGINQLQPNDTIHKTGTPDVVAGPHDVRDSSLKSNGRIDPLFVNYTPGDSSVAVGTQGFWLDSVYNTTYDFHLIAGSPVIGKGTANVPSFWNTTPITFTEHNPASYNSPLASTTPGAFGGPVTSVVISPKPIILKVDSTKSLTADVTPWNADTVTVTWSSSNPEVATVNSTSGLVTGVHSGTAYIRAISNSNNLIKDSTLVSIASGAGVLSASENITDLKVYPNPVNTELNIQFFATSELTIIAVYSLIGQALISTSVSNSTGDVTYTIPVDGLAKGLYIIKVQNGDQTLIQKFIKQ